MDNILCKLCEERPIAVKKHGLCIRCYGKKSYWEKIKKTNKRKDALQDRKGYTRELEFIKIFFKHSNWIHHPVTFKLDDTSFTPDFYDGERNVFIEVSGTRQAYEANRIKYFMMQKNYPKILFEVRQVCGKLIDINERVEWEEEKLSEKA